ncbi:MAG: hypothetical protein WAO37_11355 [Thermacetogeniaceae bacterium]
MNYISIRPYVNYLINCLSSKVLYFIILTPVLLAGMRMFVFNLLDVCGVPLKASFAVSDMVLFFIVALIIFTLIDGCVPMPEILRDPNAFDVMVQKVRCAGLY